MQSSSQALLPCGPYVFNLKLWALSVFSQSPRSPQKQQLRKQGARGGLHRDRRFWSPPGAGSHQASDSNSGRAKTGSKESGVGKTKTRFCPLGAKENECLGEVIGLGVPLP